MAARRETTSFSAEAVATFRTGAAARARVRFRSATEATATFAERADMVAMFPCVARAKSAKRRKVQDQIRENPEIWNLESGQVPERALLLFCLSRQVATSL